MRRCGWLVLIALWTEGNYIPYSVVRESVPSPPDRWDHLSKGYHPLEGGSVPIRLLCQNSPWYWVSVFSLPPQVDRKNWNLNPGLLDSRACVFTILAQASCKTGAELSVTSMAYPVLSATLPAVSVFVFHCTWALFKDRIHFLLNFSLCCHIMVVGRTKTFWINSGIV
jgi:hypothetical protein